MTIRGAVETGDRLKPHQYGSANKLRWVSGLDGEGYRANPTQHGIDAPAFAGYPPGIGRGAWRGRGESSVGAGLF